MPIACFALPAAGAQNAPMNRDLDRLAEQLGLDRADHELVRLRFGHACALRVRHLLEDPAVLLRVIRDELLAVKAEYGDERRTEIRHSEEDLDILDLIAPEEVVVTLSNSGYVKRQPVSAYRAQKRGELLAFSR